MKLNESCVFFLFPSCVGSVKDHWVGKEDFFKYIEEDVFVLMFYLAFFSSQGANILLNDQGEVKLGRWKFALSALHCTGMISMTHSPQKETFSQRHLPCRVY